MSNKLPGEMLQGNLTRSGNNLTFDNDLLHLDVASRRVGINSLNPDQALTVEGSARLDALLFQGTTVTSLAGDITLVPGVSNDLIVDSGTANSLAFYGANKELVGSASLYYDGAALVIDATTTIADTTFTTGQILSDQALVITTLSGDITLAPGFGGEVVIPNLTISNLPANQVQFSDASGVMISSADFEFDSVTSTATITGTLNVDDVIIEDNQIHSLSATPLTIASQNIELSALGGDITITNAYATGVFYAGLLKELETSSALTFDNSNGILYANGVTSDSVITSPSFRTNNLEIFGNDIYSMDSGGIITVYGEATNNVLKAGDTMYGYLTLHADPVSPLQAATKNYVDQLAQGLRVKEGVDAATPDTLAALSGAGVVYDNGALGVGATLTLTNPLTTVDDFLLTAGDRVLVKNEANAAHNGIYIYNSSTLLTRDVLNDEASEVEGGDFVFVISGTLYGGTGWVQSNIVDTIGTDNIVWVQFAGQGAYLGVGGVTIDGNEISLTYPPTTANTANTTVIRSAAGNFSAGTITAALNGNANTATALQTARTINGVSFDGTANIVIASNTANTLTRGAYLTGANFNGSAATTWAVDATPLNTADKVVARDASSSFDIGAIDFATVPPAGGVARLRWNDTDGTLEVGLKGGNSTLQIGQETLVRVLNITGATIANGSTVYAHSAAGLTGRIRVQLAVGDGTIDDMRVLGVATEDILDGQEGFITVLGAVRDFDTSGTSVGEVWADGDILYLHPTIPGGMTKTLPAAPAAKMHIGMVIKADILQGTIFVRVQHAGILDELSNVNVTAPADRDLLLYDNALGYWENGTLTKSDVGLSNVDNTADLDKPVSTATQSAIDLAVSAFQPLDTDLAALADLGTTGIIVRTGAGTVATRSVAVSGLGISLTNGDGIAGNPTITSNASSSNTVSTLVFRDASGNFSAGTVTAALAGNATTATALETARSINGTSFNGAADITTASWGTSRTLTIGDTGKAVDGSAAVTWSLAEIGADNASNLVTGTLDNARTTGTALNTIDTLVLRDASGNFSAGTITADLTGNASTATTLQTARTINGVSFNGSANIGIQWQAVLIPDSADLNTYQSEGVFYIPTNAGAATLANSPTANAFTMRVWRTSGVIQEITEYLTSTSRKTYQRAYHSGVWSAWARVYTTIDAPTKTDVGLGNVDNTSDLNKPISTATQSALDGKLSLTGGTITGSITVTGSINGSVATAATLTTPRNIALSGDVTGSVAFDGSADVSITATVADDSHNHIISNVDGLQTALDGKSDVAHTHSYLPLAGGTLTGNTLLNDSVKLQLGTGTDAEIYHNGTHTYIDQNVTGDLYIRNQRTSGVIYLQADNSAGTLQTVIQAGVGADNACALFANNVARLTTTTTGVTVTGTATATEFAGSGASLTDISATNITIGTLDNARTTGVSTNTINTLVLRDASGDFSAGTITAALAGNATTATTLQTARTINGTSFNGSANITTSSWGTSRTITIGATGKAVDGSAAVSWSLAEIGADNASNLVTGTIANARTTGTSANTANTLVLRDASGNFSAGVITATTTAARYADLAENYVADAAYEPGTVLEFGGDQEVTLATEPATHRVAGIVSTNPAYLMNSELAGEFVVALALQGRVPCKVQGTVRKGDILVAAGNGAARAWDFRDGANPRAGAVIGKALANSDSATAIIEVVVGRD